MLLTLTARNLALIDSVTVSIFFIVDVTLEILIFESSAEKILSEVITPTDGKTIFEQNPSQRLANESIDAL